MKKKKKKTNYCTVASLYRIVRFFEAKTVVFKDFVKNCVT